MLNTTWYICWLTLCWKPMAGTLHRTPASSSWLHPSDSLSMVKRQSVMDFSKPVQSTSFKWTGPIPKKESTLLVSSMTFLGANLISWRNDLHYVTWMCLAWARPYFLRCCMSLVATARLIQRHLIDTHWFGLRSLLIRYGCQTKLVIWTWLQQPGSNVPLSQTEIFSLKIKYDTWGTVGG